jgi:hypothetical protein
LNTQVISPKIVVKITNGNSADLFIVSVCSHGFRMVSMSSDRAFFMVVMGYIVPIAIVTVIRAIPLKGI